MYRCRRKEDYEREAAGSRSADGSRQERVAKRSRAREEVGSKLL